jgi:hypothetical protein
MRTALFVTIAALCSASAYYPITAAKTGVTAKALSGTPTTEAILMAGPQTYGAELVATPQLSLTLAVTPGTTTVVDVRCYESQDGANFDAISICDSTVPKAACTPDIRQYTLSAFSGTVRYIPSRWVVTKKYVKCSADDPNDGSGTVTITGSRS